MNQQISPRTTLLAQFCETGTRRRCMLSLSGVLDVGPPTSADRGGDSDGRDVDAGGWNWEELDGDVGVVDGADATGDAALPADVDAGRTFDDSLPFRLAHHSTQKIRRYYCYFVPKPCSSFNLFN